MTTTLSGGAAARLKRTHVRSGGRPVDPLIASFEGNLDALVVEKDDLAALGGALHSLRCAQSIERTLVRQLLAGVNPPGGLETRLRAMQSITERLLNHLSFRTSRLTVAIPELQRIVSATSDELEERRRFKALARSCQESS